MSAAAKILDRLLRVKQTRPDNWSAACPRCQSRNGRPISVREMEDGRVLLHAFCGCGTDDVLSAVGLTVTDLFERPLASHLPAVRGGLNARELLELVHHEVTVAAILTSDAEGRQLTAIEAARLRQTSARIGKALAFG